MNTVSQGHFFWILANEGKIFLYESLKFLTYVEILRKV